MTIDSPSHGGPFSLTDEEAAVDFFHHHSIITQRQTAFLCTFDSSSWWVALLSCKGRWGLALLNPPVFGTNPLSLSPLLHVSAEHPIGSMEQSGAHRGPVYDLTHDSSLYLWLYSSATHTILQHVLSYSSLDLCPVCTVQLPLSSCNFNIVHTAT